MSEVAKGVECCGVRPEVLAKACRWSRLAFFRMNVLQGCINARTTWYMTNILMYIYSDFSRHTLTIAKMIYRCKAMSSEMFARGLP